MDKITEQLEEIMLTNEDHTSEPILEQSDVTSADKIQQIKKITEQLAQLEKMQSAIVSPVGMLQEQLENIAQLTSPKSTNAEEAYEKITETLTTPPVELKAIPTGPHRTLVIIEASANSSDAFKERAKRFVSGSFNTSDAMKAQIVTITDGKIYAGLVFTGEKSGGLDNSSPLVYDFVVRVSDQEWN